MLFRSAALHQLARNRTLPRLAVNPVVTFVGFDNGFVLKRLSTASQRRDALRAHGPVPAAHPGDPSAFTGCTIRIGARPGQDFAPDLPRPKPGVGMPAGARILVAAEAG